MTSKTTSDLKAKFHKGQTVTYSGYRMHIVEIHSGQLDGMVTLDNGRGQTTVDLTEIEAA